MTRIGSGSFENSCSMTPGAPDRNPTLLAAMRIETGEIEIAGHRYITARALSRLLGVTERTLARWNARRIGPPKITIGKTILFDVAKLPDWLAARETQPIRNPRH